VAIVWELNRLRRSLMLMVLAWANSLHDPATYARLYSGPPAASKSGLSALIGAAPDFVPKLSRLQHESFTPSGTGFVIRVCVSI